MESTNPAGRLHEILTKAKQGGGSPLNVWSRVFELSDYSAYARDPNQAGVESQIEVISRILQLRQLIDDAEDSLLRVEGLSEKYFRPFQRIRPLIHQSLASLTNADLSGILNQITEGDMTVLEFCSERLEERHAEPVVDDKKLQEILEDVTLLFDEVRSSESIDVELKSFILDGLEAIRRGINEFRIRGPVRLKEALGEVIGSLAVNQGIVKDHGNEETVGRFEKLCYRLAAVVSFASDATGLLTAMKVGLLPGGG